MESKSGSRMNRRLMVNAMSTILLIEGIAMIPSCFLGLLEGDKGGTMAMGISGAIVIAFALIGKALSREHKVKMRVSESYFIVLVCWLTAILGGMLPYMIFGFLNGGITISDSIFESVASWTTTNAWVVNINLLPKSIVLWKAMSRWLGGMGMILLTIVVFSILGVNAQKLANVEVAGPEFEKHTARMGDTAKLLYVLYGAGTLIETVLLILAGLPIFEAVINAMSTISTAGTMDYMNLLSLHYNWATRLIIITFSILASINFAIYVRIIQKKLKLAFMDFELHLYLIIIAASTVFATVVLMVSKTYLSLGDSFLHALTGVVSFSSTTGFNLEHVQVWPPVLKFLFVILMIIGGCSTSTAGGLKIMRFAVFVKLIRRGVYKRIHPRAVKPVMIRDVAVSTGNASAISTYILLFFGIYLLSALVLSLENFDMETTLTAPIAMLTNCGIGFGQLGELGFRMFSVPGRLFSALLMLVGRLEMFALLIVFSRSFWNPNRTK